MAKGQFVKSRTRTQDKGLLVGIVAHSQLVVDTRNATACVKRGRHKIVKA